MLKVNFSNLNKLEVQIHTSITAFSKENDAFSITKAAEISGCSTSKISKFVKKLGFANYKQYMDFVYGKEIMVSKTSSELDRIKNYIEEFDTTLVEKFYNLIKNYDHIVLFGYGPSGLCAQYFEYRLRTCSKKMIVSVSDEILVESLVNENSLLVIFTVTGTFKSFENIYKTSKAIGCEVAILVEEYNSELFTQCDKIFFLSEHSQPRHLLPYEKSRTIFFIFMEEVVQRILIEKLK